jgi:hypothetical protein
MASETSELAAAWAWDNPQLCMIMRVSGWNSSRPLGRAEATASLSGVIARRADQAHATHRVTTQRRNDGKMETNSPHGLDSAVARRLTGGPFVCAETMLASCRQLGSKPLAKIGLSSYYLLEPCPLVR